MGHSLAMAVLVTAGCVHGIGYGSDTPLYHLSRIRMARFRRQAMLEQIYGISIVGCGISRFMKLADYLFDTNLTPADLRRELGHRNGGTISRWLRGVRKPNFYNMCRLMVFTRGQVTPADFLDPSPPKCATFVQLPDGTKKMVLPWCNRDALLDACLDSTVDEPEEDDPPEPVMEAIRELGPRVTRQPSGWYFLDRRPSTPKKIVEAANRMRHLRNKLPIPYPGMDPTPSNAHAPNLSKAGFRSVPGQRLANSNAPPRPHLATVDSNKPEPVKQLPILRLKR